MKQPDIWRLTTSGHAHEVAITEHGLGRRVAWSVDGQQIDNRWTMDERLVLTADGRGAVGLHFTTLGRTRRVSWFDVDSAAAAHAANQIPLSGTDFEPRPDSPAARRLEWMREHPRLYTARSALVAAAGVLLGIVAVSLLVRLVVHIPRPNWSLPAIPWPAWNLPEPPWPDWMFPQWDLPEWSLPPWLAAIASAMKYIVPVVIAAGIAYAETQRRRRSPNHSTKEDGGPARPN